MGETTKIEWCHSTFNPWVGCTRVSPACDFCYAESWAKRTGHPELWEGERRRTSAANWQQPLKWDRQAAANGERRRVFCASLADVFDNQVPARWRDDLWHLIARTPNLDWLLLTKRPQNISKMLPDPRTGVKPWGDRGWPNVWLGTTSENQPEYNRRWPHLAAIPAVVHFISYEPALGLLDIWAATGTAPDWVIAGGESGPKARAPHPDWFRRVCDDCAAAGIPFLFKQHGEWIGVPDLRHLPGGSGPGFGAYDHCFHDAEHEAVRVGKKAAGRMLDGREWNGFPEVRQ